MNYVNNTLTFAQAGCAYVGNQAANGFGWLVAQAAARPAVAGGAALAVGVAAVAIEAIRSRHLLVEGAGKLREAVVHLANVAGENQWPTVGIMSVALAAISGSVAFFGAGLAFSYAAGVAFGAAALPPVALGVKNGAQRLWNQFLAARPAAADDVPPAPVADDEPPAPVADLPPANLPPAPEPAAGHPAGPVVQ